MRAGATGLIGFLVLALSAAVPASSRSVAGPPIPVGWKLDASANGDLTGDGIADAAIVIRRADPKRVIHNDGLGTPELDTNPRRLLVFARTVSGFSQIAAADHLIPPAAREDSVCLEDPLSEGGISIRKHVLAVNLHYWLSCGSWGVTSNTYVFKWMASRFRLIGYDRMEFMRNSGEGEKVSVNFLTSRKTTTPFAIDDSTPERLRWTRIKPQRHYLDAIDLETCPAIDAKTYLC